jgi:hypothetical protein
MGSGIRVSSFQDRSHDVVILAPSQCNAVAKSVNPCRALLLICCFSCTRRREMSFDKLLVGLLLPEACNH